MKKSSKSKKEGPEFYKCKTCLGYISLKKKKSHRCEMPTEKLVLSNLEDEPREAWLKLKKFTLSLGPQVIYCSAKAIMFSRDVCFMFVRSKKKKIEICILTDRKISHSTIKKTEMYSATRFRHLIDVYHEDSIEEPLSTWISEAWVLSAKNLKTKAEER